MTRLPLALTCTAALALTGWWSATRRGNALQRQVDAYRDENWHTAEEMVEFAGRCAWHAGNDALRPPMHLLGPEHVEDYARGYWAEQADEDAANTAWNNASGLRAAE